jgi:hypothetical protein
MDPQFQMDPHFHLGQHFRLHQLFPAVLALRLNLEDLFFRKGLQDHLGQGHRCLRGHH